MAAVNKLLLKFLLLLGVFHCQAVELRVYKGSFTNYVTVPLYKSCGILAHIDPSKVTIFYGFGQAGSPTGPIVEAIVKALLETTEYNVIVVDWSKEAQVGPLGVAVSYASTGAPNAIKIGCELGIQLAYLVNCGLDTKNIYLIGHSLGSHMMGEAGRCALNKGILVPRITGLDPSGPLFEGFIKFPPLDKASAYFVDVIHTDTFEYGSNSTMGTVDIYPNYSVTGKKQPGCPDGNFEKLSAEDICSHNRAVLLFCEGIRNPHSLVAVAAKNYYDWLKWDEDTSDVTYIGPLTKFTAYGNYYMTTNPQSPFSKGTDGLAPPQQ